MDLATLLRRPTFTHEDRIRLLSATDPAEIAAIRDAAREVLLRTCGPNVYYRGLIEFTNICSCDCFYCGIRRSNRDVKRYELTVDDIVAPALWCAAQGYGSVVLQSGERRDRGFIDTVVAAVRRIKAETRCDALPAGVGVTLCVGEQSRETYQRFFDAGAHRYLLRIETSNPRLFAQLHPPAQSFDARVNCLRLLRETGFQVGTGVMIGLPGQTVADLADDVDFFIAQDVDMIGMGPFIPHPGTPLGNAPIPPDAARLQLGLLMIAVTRLSLPDVNIAATTALQALDPMGREKGLSFGANVIMPLTTPANVRGDYLLYPGKPCLHESNAQCRGCLDARVHAAGRQVVANQWGDSLHAVRRRQAEDNRG